MAADKLKLFDFLKALTETKVDLTEHPRFMKDYNPFIINLMLSMNKQTAVVAIFANKMLKASKKAHFLFCLHGIDKKRYYFEYIKKGGNENNEAIELIKKYYGVNEDKAEDYLKILNDEQLNNISKIYGGLKK